MKTSKLLRLAARDYLTKYNEDHAVCESAPDKASCLCLALGDAARGQDHRRRAYERAKTYIAVALGAPTCTLEDWLVQQGCIMERDRIYRTKELSLQIQNHRRAWAEQMAQHFESLGD